MTGKDSPENFILVRYDLNEASLRGKGLPGCISLQHGGLKMKMIKLKDRTLLGNPLLYKRSKYVLCTLPLLFNWYISFEGDQVNVANFL